MRKELVLVSFIALSACGGGGPTTVGSSAPPPGSGNVPGNNNNGSTHSFVNPTAVKTYSAIGGTHSYHYSTDDRVAVGDQYNQLYTGNASTARNSGITITYDPRDAIFEVVINDALAGVNQNLRFQDPAHRTDFGGLREPQEGVPNISSNIRYLQSGSASGAVRYGASPTFPVGDAGGSTSTATFFYQIPGTTTSYVTFAGYVRNATNVNQVVTPSNQSYLRQDNVLERAAFVFGERTQNNAVPTSGSGTYTGEMVATMVYNPLIDTQLDAPTYFQWITGTSTTTVNFGASSFTSSFAGTVGAPTFDVFTSKDHDMPAGSTFTATGSGQIDLVNKGGFAGQVDTMTFNRAGGGGQVVFKGAPTGTEKLIAGSSIDGAFYGPAAEEVGGGFRIVGGTPDERIDVLGAFTGKK